MSDTHQASRLAIVILAVEDLERSVLFYATALGASQCVTSASYVELEIGGATRLGLYERVAFGRNIGCAPAPAIAGEVSRTELYFRVDDLAASIAKLQVAGARMLSPASERPWGEIAAYFADPDGNVLVVSVPS